MKKFWLPLLIAIIFNIPSTVFAQEIDPRDLYHEAVVAREKNDIPKAQEIFHRILKDYPDFKDREMISQELRDLNLNLIIANLKTPIVTHEVAEDETLGKIAKKYGTTIDLIKRENRLQKSVIWVGQKLNIWTGKLNLIIDKTNNTLTVKNGEQVVKVYSVSTGKDDSSPEGEFTITSKMVNPVWYHNGDVIEGGAANNLLGTRWLGFDLPQYGIHGTLAPEFIGQSVSKGCVRMLNADVEELFEYIPEGTKVQIVKGSASAPTPAPAPVPAATPAPEEEEEEFH